MYYFDRDYLKKYLDVAPNGIKVHDGKGWYVIADKMDLEDSEFAATYDPANEGEQHMVDYKSIEKVKVGNMVYTKDQLNKLYSDEEDAEDADVPKPDEEGEDDMGKTPPERDEKGRPEPSDDDEEEVDIEEPIASGREYDLYDKLYEQSNKLHKKLIRIYGE